MDLHLRGKIVVVTGAAGGLGEALGRAFCQEGAQTIFTDIDKQGLQRAVEGFEGAIPIPCDVSDPDSVAGLFRELDRTFGKLHVLVNNAAVNTADYIRDIREDDLKRVLDVNVRGYVYTTREAIPRMIDTGFGRLIFINSGSGLKASSGMSLYSGSKYFNRGFAISAALELGKYNITANSICPSDIYPAYTGRGGCGACGARSWLTESLLRVSLEKEGVATFEELKKKRIAKNPMLRSCTMEDVVNLALFLAGEGAGFINGQSIGLNGGLIPY
jgi:NAD(P)-dependent dehydrogenase (short-subunit alcohol dehydrogenase family)